MGVIAVNHLRFILLSNYHVCPHHGVNQAEQALDMDSEYHQSPKPFLLSFQVRLRGLEYYWNIQ